nr:U5 small nuclear ribonucleoprotein 200 kDa helicase [Paratrimastix eleionoma]
MAEKESGKYQANVVLAPENRVRNAEPTGEADSLAGKLMKMGDRAIREKPPHLQNSEKAQKRRTQKDEEDEEGQRTRRRVTHKKKKSESVLTAKTEAGMYRPKTKETRAAFERLLSFLSPYVGDVDHEALLDVRTEVLGVLQNDKLKDFEKKAKIELILNSTFRDDKFTELVSNGRYITDFSVNETQNTVSVHSNGSNLGGSTGSEMDAEEGVAVRIDDDDDSEGDYPLHVVYSEDVAEEDGVEADTGATLAATVLPEDMNRDVADLLDPTSIDAFWVQREVSKFEKDHEKSLQLANEILTCLGSSVNSQTCENELVTLLHYFQFDFVKLLLKNRQTIFYCSRLKQAQSEQDRHQIEEEMVKQPETQTLLETLQEAQQSGGKGVSSGSFEKTEKELKKFRQTNLDAREKAELKSTHQTLDLSSLTFEEGAHKMTNKKWILPTGSHVEKKKGFEEVHIPAPAPEANPEPRVRIDSLPEWTHVAFSGVETLNPVQSKVFPVAFQSNENMLICAPTGAGKTNVAMLCILHEMGLHMNESHELDLNAFKIVYIAPMKSLVAEMVLNLGGRLKSFGISVKELTGDTQLTKTQIGATQVIVTTPEKWDIVTRKAGDRTFTQFVKLVIIDEVHLLHDNRGPVLESIVARVTRQVEMTQEVVRLVGLSATLPNYDDVARFLRVKDDCLFHFPNSARPVPLKQCYIGISEKKATKKIALMNEIVYEKVVEHAGKENKEQVLVFVHSRKEAAKTAKAIKDMALQNDTLGRFVKEESSREILASETDHIIDEDLKELLPYGIGIHHAGMRRSDRTLVEELFADRHLELLVSTATLAWGVNLPAHTVIIKGTQIYSPEKGSWVELSHLDILQMLGRAGRPQYDVEGEGIIITSHSELQYYLFVMNERLPIESQMISRLPDQLNAEIVLGNATSIQEAADWLNYTYLYVRMLKNPSLYGISPDMAMNDPILEQRRCDLCHTAATILDKAGLTKYDRKTGILQMTELGRIASHYYITHTTMSTYAEHLKPHVGDIELFRVFALSDEFKYLAVREEEKVELQRWLEQVPVPVKESVDETLAKVNVLLQCYISQVSLDGFALLADMVYITQSADRLMRAIFEFVLKQGWSSVAKRALELCKMVDRRMWSSQTPLRQFTSLDAETIQKVESRDIEWETLAMYNVQQLGELLRNAKMGKQVYKCIHQVPRLTLEAHVQPITRSMLRIDMVITPDFQWDEEVHGNSEPFWIFVEDVDGEQLLHHEYFILKKQYAEEDHSVTFFVPLYEPLPPQYFVRVISDRWLSSEATLPISFRHLILPAKYPPHTELLDLQPLPVTALDNPSFEALYKEPSPVSFKIFNPIQTQVFTTLYKSDDNVFVGAPNGSGKTICAEFSILRALTNPPEAYDGKNRIVYVAPHPAICKERYQDWKQRFGEILGLDVEELTGEASADLRILDRADIVITTPEKWDILSRRWRQRKNISRVTLFIVDEMHLIGGNQGPTLEIICSRMRYLSSQKPEGEPKIRMVALSCPVANAKDLGEWIGTGIHGLFNFHPSVRPLTLEIHISGFDIPNFQSRMLAMSKPTFNAIKSYSEKKPSIIFVPSFKQAQTVAFDLLTYASAEKKARMFIHEENLPFIEEKNDSDNKKTDDTTTDMQIDKKRMDLQVALKPIRDQTIRELAEFGVGILHEGLTKEESATFRFLYDKGVIQVLVATHELCWGMTQVARLVVVMGTAAYEGREHRYEDYPVTEILQMMGRANRYLIDDEGKCAIFCHAPKKEYYMKFLKEPFPVESHLQHFLADHLNAEIVTETIANMQDAVDYLTWTFMYRRLTQNPNYYNLQGVTHRHLSDHLSRLVETTMEYLTQSRCVEVDAEGELTSQNLGKIAAFYYIKYTTIELFANSLKSHTKMKGLLEILSSASEFDDLPVRHHEEALLEKYAKHLPIAFDQPKYHDPHVKAEILLQLHFSRTPLNSDLQRDTAEVLRHSIRLIQAMVDVLSSNGWLAPALAAMELAQMVTQGLWNRNDSPLKQLPYFKEEIAHRFQEKGIENVFDFMGMEDDQRKALLTGFSLSQMKEIADVCNGYPNIGIQFTVSGNPNHLIADEPVSVDVVLEREGDDNEVGVALGGPAYAPRYPTVKDEGWWVAIGDPKQGTLVAIKRTSFQRKTKVHLEFTAPSAGNYTFLVYLMCDAYMGCDQELEMPLTVVSEQEEGNHQEDNPVESHEEKKEEDEEKKKEDEKMNVEESTTPPSPTAQSTPS